MQRLMLVRVADPCVGSGHDYYNDDSEHRKYSKN